MLRPLALMFCLLSANSYAGKMLVNLDMEGPEYRRDTFLSPLSTDGAEWPVLRVPQKSSVLSLPGHETTVEPGTDHQFWMTSSHQVSGQRSLGFAARSSKSTASARDKIVMHLFRHKDKDGIDFRSPTHIRRYVSFNMKFAHNYELPDISLRRSYTLHMQAWQESKQGPPPFAMYVKPVPVSEKRSAKIELLFVARNEELVQRNDGPISQGKIVGRVTVERDQWNHIIFQLDPSDFDDDRVGQAAVWINGKRLFVYRGDWGYSPDRAADASSRIGVNIGIYRSRQNVNQTVFFDDIKVGGDYADHAPAP